MCVQSDTNDFFFQYQARHFYGYPMWYKPFPHLKSDISMSLQSAIENITYLSPVNPLGSQAIYNSSLSTPVLRCCHKMHPPRASNVYIFDKVPSPITFYLTPFTFALGIFLWVSNQAQMIFQFQVENFYEGKICHREYSYLKSDSCLCV